MGRLPAPHHITSARLARVLLIALAAFGTAPSAPAQPPPREWKRSTAVGPAFALGKAGARWATLIGEKSGGSLAVKPHPGATLAQRIRWHTRHVKHCGCRPIPDKLLAELKRRRLA